MQITETVLLDETLGDGLAGNKDKTPGFVDIYKYPEVVELCKKIKAADKLLHRLSKVIPYMPWDDPMLCDERWKVAAMRYAYVDHNPLVPFLLSPEIRSAGFATLEPGAHIKPHTGYAGDVFRIHYGIDVPEGDCCFRVGNQVKRWENGKFFMFNDLDVHEAWNRTDKTRVVLLVDVAKSFLPNVEEDDLREWN